jgi:four helix bundle protein
MTERPPYDLRRRTMDFALRILRLSAKLPNTPEAQAIRRQIVRSGTSPGAHYREARRPFDRSQTPIRFKASA